MVIAEIWSFCRSLPGCTDGIQWENDRVFKVGEKMFACTGLTPASKYSFKVDDDRFLELTDQPGISPAPYLARAKWVQIDPATCGLGKQEICQLLKRSHELVVAKLSKKKQREIGAIA